MERGGGAGEQQFRRFSLFYFFFTLVFFFSFFFFIFLSFPDGEVREAKGSKDTAAQRKESEGIEERRNVTDNCHAKYGCRYNTPSVCVDYRTKQAGWRAALQGQEVKWVSHPSPASVSLPPNNNFFLFCSQGRHKR